MTLKDGTYAIFHIGTGTGSPNGGENCTATHSDAQLPWETFQEYDEKSATVDGSTIHTSKSVAGPWEPLMTNTYVLFVYVGLLYCVKMHRCT